MIIKLKLYRRQQVKKHGTNEQNVHWRRGKGNFLTYKAYFYSKCSPMVQVAKPALVYLYE